MIALLYCLTALELFLGGGGRLLEIGSVTLRMVLFALCLLASAWMLVASRRLGIAAKPAIALTAAYLLAHVPGALQGLARASSLADIGADLQPTLYWLAAPFIASALASMKNVLRTATLVRIASFVLSAGYIAVVIALLGGWVDFTNLYAALEDSGEFFFRGETFFFYKGFLYLAIGLVFLTALRGRTIRFELILVGIALVLTLTRGLVLATTIVVLLMLISSRRWTAVLVAAGLGGAALLAVWIYAPAELGLLEQRELSDLTRLDDLSFIMDRVTPGTLLVGEGLGAPVNGRLNIENTYLWIFWKLGLLGLLFWLVPLALCAHHFRRVRPNDPQYRLACAYLYGVLLVYVQTATNPFLNNPIGLSFVLIALFSLRTLAASRPITAAASRAAIRPPPAPP